jgi:hypothetical protein
MLDIQKLKDYLISEEGIRKYKKKEKKKKEKKKL